MVNYDASPPRLPDEHDLLDEGFDDVAVRYHGAGSEPPLTPPPGRGEPDWQGPARRIVLRVVLVAIPVVALVLFFTGRQEVSAPNLDSISPDQTVRAEVAAPPEARRPALPLADPSASPTDEASVGPVKEIDFVDTDPNTFWISPDGNDGADGQTPDTPWSSLQGALERVQPGQTIFLMTGRYGENRQPGYAHYVLTNSGTEQDWIRVAAGPGQEPVIVATDGNGIEVKGSYVEISGIEVVGEGFGVDNSYGWGFLVRGAHHVRLVGNTASQMPVGGISAIDSDNIEILYNEVYDNAFWGTEQGSGISIWHAKDSGFGPGPDGYSYVLVGNVAYRNENKVFSRWKADQGDIITDGNGIIIDQTDETGYTGRTLVANNLSYDNGGRGILVLESSRVDVVHNTTYGNGRTEILEGGPVELAAGRTNDVRFFNNLAWSLPGADAVRVNNSNNVVMGGNVLVTDSDSTPATDLDLVTTTNPGLIAPGVDPALVDFRPAEGSLLIGRAIPISPQISVDAVGLLRPADGATVGAYETLPG